MKNNKLSCHHYKSKMQRFLRLTIIIRAVVWFVLWFITSTLCYNSLIHLDNLSPYFVQTAASIMWHNDYTPLHKWTLNMFTPPHHSLWCQSIVSEVYGLSQSWHLTLTHWTCAMISPGKIEAYRRPLSLETSINSGLDSALDLFK